MTAAIDNSVTTAAARMEDWLRTLPEWQSHATNESRTVSGHFGPTILSEHDCVLHFARFLAEQASDGWACCARHGHRSPPEHLIRVARLG